MPRHHRRAMAKLCLARRMVRADRYDRALDAIRNAIELEPSARLYDYQGVLLSLLGQRRAALSSFASALTYTCDQAEQATIHFHRALLYGREQAYDQALEDLNKALALQPTNETYREAKEILMEEQDRSLAPV